MDEKTFKIEQPDLSLNLSNAIKKNKISQAYMLWGGPRCNFNEVGKFIAKSLLCENKGLACDKCKNCIRFNNGYETSFYVIRNLNKKISKEQIEQLKSFFEMSISSNERVCYLIVDCQDLKEEAANSLLKFLEEP